MGEGFGFQFVCRACLASRGVLESPDLPGVCPECGLEDPWVGPIARSRFDRPYKDALAESPFYLAATQHASRGDTSRA